MSSSGDLRPPPDRFFGPLSRATKRQRFQWHLNIIPSPQFPACPKACSQARLIGEGRKSPEHDIRRIAKIFIQ